jgi:hypothetical protein
MKGRGHRIPSHRCSAFRLGLNTMAAVCLLFAMGACRKTPANPPADRPVTEVARLERSTALLDRQAELAGGKEFYLLLDAARSDLTLMLRGAELRRFAILGLQVGYPRVWWVSRRDPNAWQGVIWSNGELDPPRAIDRIVLTAEQAGESETEPPPIPPSAEELYPVPPRFHVRFSGGLSVEVRPREADAAVGRIARLRAWWSAKWGDVMAAIGSTRHDVVRLRVVLDPKEADSLYRSLPPAVRLLVLSGSPIPAQEPAAAATPATSTR